MIKHTAIVAHRASMPSLSGSATPIAAQGQNRKYRVGSYFLKMSQHSNKVFDICEREEMASIFGHLLSVPIVRAWTLPTSGITFPHSFDNSFVRDKCVVMDFIHGSSLSDDRIAAANWVRNHIRVVADIMAYMHWIGDDDRGLEDIMMTGDKVLLVDNGLTGPPTFGSPLRSSHPFARDFDPIQALKKCYPGKSSFVAFAIRDIRVSCDELKQPDFINRCLALHSDDLHGIIEGLGMQPSIAEVLDRRRQTLHDEYHNWIEKLRLAHW